MKQLISYLLVFVQLFSLFSSQTFAGEATKKFIVTAYYSPLPDQSFYLKGSYEADIRLNGNGTHGASGKGVYPGMLAAPKSYTFGTKIYLHGLGVGTVDDRGGAIVGSGSRGYDADRLDMWMGTGEEGLKRALTWGKRTVTGKVISPDEAVNYDSVDLQDVRIGKINKALYQKQETAKVSDDTVKPLLIESIFAVPVTKNSSPDTIKKLQNILKDLSYFEGEIDGKYSKKLEDAVYDFQIENKLVMNRKNTGAGFYGVKTRAKLGEIYALYKENEQKKAEEVARLALEKVREEARLAGIRKEASLFVASLGTPENQEVGMHVRKLQQTLKLLGYFTGKDTAIFGKNTREALIKYQIDRQIISKADELGAGSLTEKTRTALQDDLYKAKITEKTVAFVQK